MKVPMVTVRVAQAFLAAVVGRLKDVAPYAAMELILPGGSLMAVLLWLYRRRKKAPGWGSSTEGGAFTPGVRVEF